MKPPSISVALTALLALGLLTGQPLLAQEKMDEVVDAKKIHQRGKPAKPIKQEPPIYPQAMARAGLIGVVVVDIIIDQQGNVTDAVVVESNNPWFERSAVDAVLGWKFEPAQLDGRPVKMRVQQSIVFRLDSGGRTPDIWRVAKGKEHDKLPLEFQWETPPTPTHTLFPVYPFELLKAGTKGTVKIAYIVGSKGQVVAAKLLEAATPELGQAVLAMIDAWRFEPAKKKDGTAAYARLASEYEFQPNGRGDVPVTGTALKILSDLEKKPGSIVTLEALDEPLKPTSRRPPVYPTALRGSGQAGEAVIEFFVDKNGDAQLPRIVSSTAPGFGFAAVQAVATWRFEPPKRGGKPVVVRTRIPVIFSHPPTHPAAAK